MTRRTAPRRASPRRASTPRTATPRTATPRTATPRTATPRTATRRTATPRTATRRTGARRPAVARLVALAVLIGLALVGTAGPASAHNVLVSTDPADGASLDAGPASVTLTFDQPVQSGFNTITVTGPGDTRWTDSDVTTSGNTATTAVRPLGPAGEYVVGYRVVSADGHPVSGEVRFRLTTAGTGTPVAAGDDAAVPAGDDGFPVWPVVVGAVVLLGAGVVVALRLARPRA